jgi:hypothetical protein
MGHSRELALKKIQEYLQHAADCREMARTATAVYRQQLELIPASDSYIECPVTVTG